MNARLYAIRVGARRGWTEFVQSLRSPQDQSFYLFWAIGVLIFLWFNRNNEVEGTTLLMPSVIMPSVLGALLAFGVVIGPAFTLAMEREDGTLLRVKAVPHGMTGYVTGQLILQSLGLVPMLGTILIPALLLFDGIMHRGLAGWLAVVWLLLLGLLALMPIGIVIGSLVRSVQKVSTWGMLPIMGLAAISGVFFPVQQLWGWVQVVAQIFPMYWLAHGMRWAFLPDELGALEIGGSWRIGLMIVVLVAWAIAGAVVTPIVLRRMARRQSGSQVEAAREAAAQWVR